MTALYIAELELQLHKAKKREAYWTERRHGQVNNCLSDSEHHLEAQRDVQRLEHQLKEACNGNHHSRG